jgi:hypothetical protein
VSKNLLNNWVNLLISLGNFTRYFESLWVLYLSFDSNFCSEYSYWGTVVYDHYLAVNFLSA